MFDVISQPALISSKDNAQFKALKKLARDNSGYKKNGMLWLEGDHLCRAYLQRGFAPVQAVFSSEFWQVVQHSREFIALQTIANSVQMPDELFKELSPTDAAGKMGFLVKLPKHSASVASIPTVVLDRIQDAGNVGSILRSAAAFGFRQVLALEGTASLWSPKVLRAAMGAHFALHLVEGADVGEATVRNLGIPLVCTSSHGGEALHQVKLPPVCAWVFGHEGSGVSAALLDRADLKIRIHQPGGEESLNVAAAAAVCLHQSATHQVGSS